MRTVSEKQLQDMHCAVKGAFSKVKEELDGHLDTINQNSAEIQSLYEYLVALEKKMDKLTERVDEVKQRSSNYASVDLTSREQEVFLLIYTTDTPIRISLIASRLGFNEESVKHYVRSLLAKGIPLSQHALDEDVLLSLDARFKELQARQNLVHVDESVSRQVLQEQFI